MVDLFQTKAVERVVEEVEKSLKTISDELLAEKAAVVNGSVKDETFSEYMEVPFILKVLELAL